MEEGGISLALTAGVPAAPLTNPGNILGLAEQAYLLHLNYLTLG